MASSLAVDSSAVVALMQAEPGADALARRLLNASEAVIGAPTLLECVMVLTGKGLSDASSSMESFLRHFSVMVLPWTPDHARVAIEAFLRYGKGRHSAALSFGDCQSYATAKVARLPLLFVGEDFALTDVEAA